MTSAFSMTLSHAGHLEETGEARCCEPYVLVTSIDLRRARPEVEAFLYGPWQGADPEAPDIVPIVPPISVDRPAVAGGGPRI